MELEQTQSQIETIDIKLEKLHRQLQSTLVASERCMGGLIYAKLC